MPKFITKKPRFIAGEYVFASIEQPAVIDLPEGAKPAPDLIPYKGGEVSGEKLQPAFNARGSGHTVPTSAQRDQDQKSKGKRASDDDAI